MDWRKCASVARFAPPAATTDGPAEPVLAMKAAVHGLHRLFGAPAAAFSPLRNAGMAALDGIPALKNLLVRHAMQ